MTKKGLITLLLTLFACMSSMAGTSLDDAKELVKKYVSESSFAQECLVYVGNEELTQVELYNRKPFDIPSDSWAFFIDPTPDAGMAHAVQIMLVSKSNSSYKIYKANTPIKNYKDWDILVEPKAKPQNEPVDNDLQYGQDGDNYSQYCFYKYNGVCYNSHFFNTTNGVFKKTDKKSPNSYAVIISGGVYWGANNIRYWNNCSFMYQLLVKTYGFDKDKIIILMNGGAEKSTYNYFVQEPISNPKKPQVIMPSDMDPDLDGDGKDEVIYAAYPENISAVFDELSSKITSDDDLFIFTTDHGDIDGSLCLWNKEQKNDDSGIAQNMTPKEFAKEVAKVNNAKSISMVIGQCFGGAFVNELKGPNRTIITATKADETAKCYVKGNVRTIYYSEFIYHWIMGHVDNKADEDGDGNVSFYESYKYACENDIFTHGLETYSETLLEHPQYWTDECLGAHSGLGSSTFGTPDLVEFNDPISSGNVEKQAADELVSSSVISGGDVKYYATRSISLRPNFAVKTGATFLAKIADIASTPTYECDNSSNVVYDVDPNWYKKEYDADFLPIISNDFISEVIEKSSNDFSIYPNPTSGEFTISLGETIANVTITDMLGNVITSQEASGNMVVDLSSQNKGIYLIKIVSENDTFVEKLIVK